MEIPEFFLTFSELFDDLASQYGALGIFLAMLAESAGVPFASALVILTSGQMIATGRVSIIEAIFSSTVGITAGSLLSYLIGNMGRRVGRVIGTTLFSRKIKKTPYQQTKFSYVFEKYGPFSIFLAQLWGTTRTFISFPAGAMQMNILLFLAYTALGGVIYSLLAIGFSILLHRFFSFFFRLLGEILQLPIWVWPIAVVVFLIICYMAYRLIKRHLERKRKQKEMEEE